VFELPDVSEIVALALAEDLGVVPEQLSAASRAGTSLLQRDVTTSTVIDSDARFSGTVVARQDGVVAGLPLVAAVFDTLSDAAALFERVEVFPLVAEGSTVSAGTPVLEVEGVAWAVLAGERTALDFLMLLSGIATETARWVTAAGPDLAVCDTRKTWPGMRMLSKYAVAIGGGTNHRVGLWDMALIKDNHIRRAGGISAAVASVRDGHPDLRVEVEAETLAQAEEAARAGADIVLLDNMSDGLLTEAVLAVREISMSAGRTILTEASGSVTSERLAALRGTGVDRVSTSVLTLQSRPVDFGLDES
jgi:nicotinate-nucleotide pyrophosphorylase (carboxylating)